MDPQQAKTVAADMLKTRAKTVDQNRNIKEMKTQLLEYMQRGEISDLAIDETDKIVKAVESPIRFTLIEAIRVKFTDDGVESAKIEDWLREVKEIRRSRVKSTRHIIKIAKTPKPKTAGTTKKGGKGVKGVSSKASTDAATQRKRAALKVRFMEDEKSSSSDSKENPMDPGPVNTSPLSLEPNVPMQKV